MMKKKQIIILAIIILFFAAYLADRNEEKEADRNKEPDVTVAATSETTTEQLQNTEGITTEPYIEINNNIPFLQVKKRASPILLKNTVSLTVSGAVA